MWTNCIRFEAINEAQNQEEEELQHAELEKLWKDPSFDSLLIFEVQRYNLMIFANRTRFRGDTWQH